MPLEFLELPLLFAAAFLSASLLAFQSELFFAGMLAANHYPDWILLAVASMGNTMGAALNWWLGLYITKFEGKRWFPVKKAALQRAEGWFQRWGKWLLLLSWVPIIGDPLTMIAGVLRVPFLTFFAVVAVAKTSRYLALMIVI